MRKQLIKKNLLFAFILSAAVAGTLQAQTDNDAIMMAKKNLCIGGMYSYNSWTNYWEGTFKRNNDNLGKVSTQMIGLMGNYGITNNLNAIFSVPYVKTKVTKGVLGGFNGMQDLSLWLKWKAYQHNIGKGKISLYALGGMSTPLSDYNIDMLPLSIGLGSTTFTGRVMADYQYNKFFVTAHGSYSRRNNVKLDRTGYYTTELHLTNEVEMPDMAMYGIRTGYRSKYLIADVMLSQMNTLGGFDIRKNDMPFPSNNMDATTIGISAKYTLPSYRHLEFYAGGSYVIDGRNAGQSTTINAAVFYILDFAKKTVKK